MRAELERSWRGAFDVVRVGGLEAWIVWVVCAGGLEGRAVEMRLMRLLVMTCLCGWWWGARMGE